VRGASSSSTKPAAVGEPAANTAKPCHVLPKKLRHGVAQLSDKELDELFAVAFDEAKRRGRLPRSVSTELMPSAIRPSAMATKRLSPTGKRRRENTAEVSLTGGQVNAVRAAFKAGITPSRIARQFGICQANVRKALASDESTR
jgi:hypothetical protein